MNQNTSRTAIIRDHAKQRDGVAERLLSELLSDLFQLDARNLTINFDQYSLNSLNGFFDSADEKYFFKFHQEEGEEEMGGEYYRADILSRAGLPVDQPVMMSTLPGEQILVYRRRFDPRFSDVLRALDLSDDASAIAEAVNAERVLNEAVLKVYLETLHPVTPEQVAMEPVHRLFSARLVSEPGAVFPGGRYESFYRGKTFAFPGVSLDWDEFSKAEFVVNGVPYRKTVGDLFEAAHARLAPMRMADGGGVTAHGDAHNANVWYRKDADGPTLAFFDPAFAGEHIPTLLAEVKTTFHNILAHPLWLYEPALAAQHFQAGARYGEGKLYADFDWRLSPVREKLLAVKAESLWKPLLAEMRREALLPADWRTVIRLGLFLCPTLVMNLRSGATSHNPTSSLIGFATAVMAGSEPSEGSDIISRFLDSIDPEHS